ncbi:MAG: hypothetical protein AAB953_02215 [Patescibacteria group bacterium]
MTITTTNRDLLRNYKYLKGKLLNGDVDEIVILQKKNIVIKMVVEKKLTPFQQLVEMVKKKPILNVKRSDQDIF